MSGDQSTNGTAYEQDGKVLGVYVTLGSADAFDELVRRHSGMVYAVCQRELRDRDLAEDASQTVFLLLARKAAGLRRQSSVAAWLFQAARFAAGHIRRDEMRRRRREAAAAIETARDQMERDQRTERAFWEQTEPLLNDALAVLSHRDRETVLLRFMEGLSLDETGLALGLSADAARMRVNRALAKMRRHLAKSGVASTDGGLSAVLLANAVSEPPAWVAQSGQVALLHTSSRLIAAGRIGRAMSWLRWKAVGLAGAVTVVAVGGVGVAASSAYLRATEPAVVRTMTAPVPVTGSPGETISFPVFAPESLHLSYTAVRRDVRSAKLRKGRTAYEHWLADIRVKRGEMAPDVAKRNEQAAVRSLQEREADRTFHVDVYVNHDKVLYRCEQLTGPAGFGITRNYVAYYDSASGVTVRRSIGQVTRPGIKDAVMVELDRGYHLEGAPCFVLTGASLKQLPTFAQIVSCTRTAGGLRVLGNIPTGGGQGQTSKGPNLASLPVWRSAGLLVPFGGNYVPRFCRAGSAKEPLDDWTFTDFTTVSGIPIAKTIVHLERCSPMVGPRPKPGEPSTLPMTEWTIKLVAAETRFATDRFGGYEDWINDDDYVEDRRSGAMKSYLYRKPGANHP